MGSFSFDHPQSRAADPNSRFKKLVLSHLGVILTQFLSGLLFIHPKALPITTNKGTNIFRAQVLASCKHWLAGLYEELASQFCPTIWLQSH